VEGHLGHVADGGGGSVEAASAVLARVRFVLCRPRNPQNVGAAARALCSAGVRDLVLVDPQCDPRDPEAFRLAVHARALLEAARVAPTLAAALEGAALSAGATARFRPERAPLSPRACTELLARAASLPARAQVALVFGDERAGLTAEEVEQVDRLSSIPSAPEQPSWNLAQAVAIYAHELRAACLAQAPAPPGPASGSRRGATEVELAGLDRALASALDRLGRGPTRRRLFRTLARARLTSREAALWSAVLAALARALARH
jgi:tRNA (cytidine32/uridine32-2'-O)-methyltransferase